MQENVFFFQAEDGIRDVAVTGVQTCALPISFIMDFTWYDTNSADSNKVYLWGNGGTYTDLTAGTQFTFSFVFTPTAWIYY